MCAFNDGTSNPTPATVMDLAVGDSHTITMDPALATGDFDSCVAARPGLRRRPGTPAKCNGSPETSCNVRVNVSNSRER